MDPLEEAIELSTSINDEMLLSAAKSNSSQQIVNLINSVQRNSLFSRSALDSAILLACKCGSQILVQFLLELGANVDYQDEEGCAPLLISAELGFSEIFKVLIKRARNVNIENRKKETALHLCLKCPRSIQIAKCFLDYPGVNVDHQDIDGWTALMKAVESINLDVVKFLLESGADLNVLLNSRGESAQNISDRIGIGKIVNLLKTKECNSPLIAAALSRDIESLNYLIHCHYSFIHDKGSNDNKIVLLFIQSVRQRSCGIDDAEIEIVTKLLETGFQVNVFEPNVGTPILLAVEVGDGRLVDLLCRYGAHVYRDVLVSAVRQGRPDLIALLASYRVAMSDISADCQVTYDGSALDVALRLEQIECAKVLLANGAKIIQESAVRHAVVEGKFESLNFLLPYFQNCANNVIANGRTELLHMAVEKGHMRIVALLLNFGVDVNYVHNKKTPLMVAYHHEMIELLLNRGCDVNIKTDTTALLNVLSGEYIKKLKTTFDFLSPPENVNVNCFLYIEEIMFVLLKYGANVNATSDDGRTALMTGSVLEGARDILKLLIDNGADINYRDKVGRTSLLLAVTGRNLENAKLLLELGADVNLGDVNGSTALHKALPLYGRMEMLKILVEHDADVNAQDDEGNIPLMSFSECFFCYEDAIKALVQAGSNVNHRNKSGMTVLMLFASKCDMDIINVFHDAGADIHAVNSDSVDKKTALSILLAESYLPGQEECVEVAEFLLDHGATARYVNPGIIHRAIARSHETLVQKLIQGGLAPQDISLENNRPWPTRFVSPLSVALFMNNVSLARHFIDIWYLTQSDVRNLSRNLSIINLMDHNGNTKCASFLRELQPLSLTLLSFIVVSTSIGVSHDRAERIEATQLPWVFKERLLFRNEGFNPENGDIESDKMLYYLAKHCPINDMEMEYFHFYSDSEGSDSDVDLNESSAGSD